MSKCECKECLHYDACKKISDVHGLAFGSSPFCEHYKPKSLFVELPCKPDDIVHTARYKETHPFKIVGINITNDKYGKMRVAAFACGTEFLAEDFGKTVFLTEEQAKAKLKEG